MSWYVRNVGTNQPSRSWYLMILFDSVVDDVSPELHKLSIVGTQRVEPFGRFKILTTIDDQKRETQSTCRHETTNGGDKILILCALQGSTVLASEDDLLVRCGFVVVPLRYSVLPTTVEKAVSISSTSALLSGLPHLHPYPVRCGRSYQRSDHPLSSKGLGPQSY